MVVLQYEQKQTDMIIYILINTLFFIASMDKQVAPDFLYDLPLEDNFPF